ncbi:MAG: FHA domain-containing protein [Xanthomonadaceae bacterium]|nr:FHA domain-containing protein [Xanthomonadaceae bacterium]
MVRLVQLLDGVPAKRFPLDKERLTIGRGPGNDIELDDLSVSIRHAVIERIGDPETAEYHIRDLESTNGTYVNEEPISCRRLHNRDIIRIGWTHFEFIDERAGQEKTMKIRKTWLPGVFISKK